MSWHREGCLVKWTERLEVCGSVELASCKAIVSVGGLFVVLSCNNLLIYNTSLELERTIEPEPEKHHISDHYLGMMVAG